MHHLAGSRCFGPDSRRLDCCAPPKQTGGARLVFAQAARARSKWSSLGVKSSSSGGGGGSKLALSLSLSFSLPFGFGFCFGKARARRRPLPADCSRSWSPPPPLLLPPLPPLSLLFAELVARAKMRNSSSAALGAQLREAGAKQRLPASQPARLASFVERPLPLLARPTVVAGGQFAATRFGSELVGGQARASEPKRPRQLALPIE